MLECLVAWHVLSSVTIHLVKTNSVPVSSDSQIFSYTGNVCRISISLILASLTSSGSSSAPVNSWKNLYCEFLSTFAKSCPVIPGSNALLQALLHCRDQLRPVFTSTNHSSACHGSILCSNFDHGARVHSRSRYHSAQDFCESHNSFSNNFRVSCVTNSHLIYCLIVPRNPFIAVVCSRHSQSFVQMQAQPGCNHPAGCLTRERALAEHVGHDRNNPLHCLF